MNMIKKCFAFAALAIVLTGQGCAGISPYKYWNIYEMTEPVFSSEKIFNDDLIKVRFWIDEKKIHFNLSNLTDQPITINWRKAAYIHIDGGKHQVANIDSAFSGRKDDPPLTIIPAGITITDFVTPSKNIKKLEEWTWYVYPLFNLQNERAFDNKGSVFGLDLPMKVAGKWHTYKFRFEISNVVPGVRRI